MGNKKNQTKPSRPPEATSEPPRVPESPPMSRAGLPRWPLIVVLAVLLAWLLWLGFLAWHSVRWESVP